MKIYILTNLIDDIKDTDYYQSKTPKQQHLIIKRCCVFIHLIHQDNNHRKFIKKYTMVGISSKLLAELLGSDYKKILKLLSETGFIGLDNTLIPRRRIKVETEHYSYHKPNLKKYWFTDKAKNCNLEIDELLDTKYELKAIEVLYREHLNNTMKFEEEMLKSQTRKSNNSVPLF